MTSSKFNKQQRKIHPLTLFCVFNVWTEKKENKIFTINQQKNLHSQSINVSFYVIWKCIYPYSQPKFMYSFVYIFVDFALQFIFYPFYIWTYYDSKIHNKLVNHSTKLRYSNMTYLIDHELRIAIGTIDIDLYTYTLAMKQLFRYNVSFKWSSGFVLFFFFFYLIG